MINCIPGLQRKLVEQRGCTKQSWASPKLSERGKVTQGPRTLEVSPALGLVLLKALAGGGGGPLPSTSLGQHVEHWGLLVGQQQVIWLFYQSELLKRPNTHSDS